AVLRADASPQLREVLSGRSSDKPLWRATPALILDKKTFSVVTGTTSEKWLADRLDQFQINATVAPVDSYCAGVQRRVDRRSDVFFGDRDILLNAAEGSKSPNDLTILDRTFTYEPLALTLARGDEDFRLVVDRTLSRLYKSGGFQDIYMRWFGEPDQGTLIFF